MTEDQVQARLNHWLATIVGVPRVIDANSDRKRPDRPYLMTNLMMSGPVHEHPVEYEYPTEGEGADEVVRQAPVRDWYWRFSVHAYGDKPSGVLRKVETASRIPTHLEGLHPLVLAETSAIRNVPEVVENAVETRANMDIELRGLVRDDLVIDVVETAPVEATQV